MNLTLQQLAHELQCEFRGDADTLIRGVASPSSAQPGDLCFALRVDNKRLPAKLVKARLELRAQDWMAERGADRIPATVKRELKEQLELELLPKQLPSVNAHDVCWDLKDHKVWFFSGSRKVNESFRLRFGQTFTLDLAPVGVMGAVSGHPMVDSWRHRLDAVGHSDYRPEQN